MTVRHAGVSIDWFGYATARLESPTGVVAYTDPGRYGVLDEYRPEDGDLVVVTHDHHYDSDGIRRVAAADATIVIYENVDADRIGRDAESVASLAEDYHVVRVAERDQLAVDGVRVRSIPGYNDPGGPHVRENGEPFHPPGFGCGYYLDLHGTTALWPGDSDALPHHEDLFVDIFLPPIGAYTMDRHEAAELAQTIDPGIVVPIHYDTFPALEADADAFAVDVANREVPVALCPPLCQ